MAAVPGQRTSQMVEVLGQFRKRLGKRRQSKRVSCGCNEDSWLSPAPIVCLLMISAFVCQGLQCLSEITASICWGLLCISVGITVSVFLPGITLCVSVWDWYMSIWDYCVCLELLCLPIWDYHVCLGFLYCLTIKNDCICQLGVTMSICLSVCLSQIAAPAALLVPQIPLAGE